MTEDSTRILGEGTEDYPLDPAAAAAEEQCPHCQTAILPGEQFCSKCGFQRGTWREGEQALAGAAAPVAEARPLSRYVLIGADGSRYPLPEGESVIGRGAEADVTIGDGYISRSHARVVITADGINISDLGSANGTFIGEERLEPEVAAELDPAASLKLGPSEFTLELTELEPVAEEEVAGAEGEADQERVTGELAEVHLEMKPALSPWQLKRTGTDEVFYLPFGESQLGRKPDKCDLLVRGDSYISGLHCRMVASLEHLEVTDLGSTNGTYLNGERCAPDQVMALSAGDTMRIGSTDLEVAYEEPAEDIETPAGEEDEPESGAPLTGPPTEEG